jgi:hypothetical protein
MSEVDAVFPRTVGGEIWALVQTLRNLPDEAKPEFSAHLQARIQEKLTALAAIKDKPGNIDAYFHIGALFEWELMRILAAGTLQERMRLVNLQYETPDQGTISGLPSIIGYFYGRYVRDGNDQALLAHARQTISKFPKT